MGEDYRVGPVCGEAGTIGSMCSKQRYSNQEPGGYKEMSSIFADQ